MTGKLELTFTVVSEYLFVGSGAYEFDPNHNNQRPDVWYTFYRRNGQICVPGTSIKGAIRAIVEAISNSCISQFRRSREKVDKDHEPCRDQNKLCPACRLFGMTGLRGRVHFSDAFPEGQVRPQIVKIGELWEPRNYSGRKFYEVKRVPQLTDKRPQRNFRFVEAMSEGTCFRATLHFENLSEAELGLMAYALGWKTEKGTFDHAFTPKLGGAKPRCFGAVKFDPARLTVWEVQKNGLLQLRMLEGDAVGAKLVRCMEAASRPETGLFHESSWRRLVEGYQEKTDTCPREMY
ncbi:RAMP superfamily CRISPR-associated protein [Rhodothermus marinus]|uniref:RAMP superfamily CRISPR-associated protein n=1 Tax=Rhodothermus marinus TaxID=29549 RepID=UPI0003013B99|nr:RAMP superfamily CRISPR-associated protein [Rhodothermus marinus]